MALREQPYFPFYVQDYLTDERLLMCSWQTQGIYVRILCNLHKQDVYGAILFKQNSKQNESTDKKNNDNINTISNDIVRKNNVDNNDIIRFYCTILCKLIQCQYEEMRCALTELLDNGVLRIDDEKLYQKRMYNDGIVSIKRSEVAKRGGGNPALRTSSKARPESLKNHTKNLFKQNSKQNTEYESEYEYENNNTGKEGMGEKPLTKIDERFETFRKTYPGAKRGYTTEIKILQKHEDWRTVIPILAPALENEMKWRGQAQSHGAFVPNWPHLQTWLNQRRWEIELNFDFTKPPNPPNPPMKIFTYDQMCDEVRGGAKQEDFEFIAKNQWRRK